MTAAAVHARGSGRPPLDFLEALTSQVKQSFDCIFERNSLYLRLYRLRQQHVAQIEQISKERS